MKSCFSANENCKLRRLESSTPPRVCTGKNITNSTSDARLRPAFDFRGKTQQTNRPVKRTTKASQKRRRQRTHINQVRQVVDVVLENGGVGRFQSQQVLVARFDRLQLVLRVLGLALMRRMRKKKREGEEEEEETDHNKVNRGWGGETNLMRRESTSD